jgi:hypothetical protein
MTRALALALALLSLAPLGASAQAASPAIQALSQCLADNTSGKDRKDLARWIFVAMAAHPEIKQFAAPNLAQGADDVNRSTAATFMRLLTESCATQTRNASREGGPMAIQLGFQTLGQLAMQELMSDASVSAGMSAFERHLDQDKLGKVLRAP